MSSLQRVGCCCSSSYEEKGTRANFRSLDAYWSGVGSFGGIWFNDNGADRAEEIRADLFSVLGVVGLRH
jgi:hypothetical protein